MDVVSDEDTYSSEPSPTPSPSSNFQIDSGTLDPPVSTSTPVPEKSHAVALPLAARVTPSTVVPCVTAVPNTIASTSNPHMMASTSAPHVMAPTSVPVPRVTPTAVRHVTASSSLSPVPIVMASRLEPLVQAATTVSTLPPVSKPVECRS